MEDTVWIDTKWGKHYHRKGCRMIADPRFPYTPVQAEHPCFTRLVHHEGRYYGPCPACRGFVGLSERSHPSPADYEAVDQAIRDDLRMEGMQVLADFVEVHQLPGSLSISFSYMNHIAIPRDGWYALLDKLGVVFKAKSITCPACNSTSVTSCPGGTCLKPSQEAMDNIKYICVDCLAEFGDLPQKEG